MGGCTGRDTPAVMCGSVLVWRGEGPSDTTLGMEPAGSAPLLEVRGIDKHFPGVHALRGVSLALAAGEVLAVIGENGAGKSTLMKVLAGIEVPDAGEIVLDGRAVRIDSTRTAMDLGIALIHQELNLADNLDVGANIFLGREPRGALGWIRRSEIEARAQVVLDQVGARFSPRTIVGTLAVGEQQLVEIAKALSLDARILIMDEPTSSLSQGETETLFRVVHDLRERGVSVIYISHRLGEVVELADRVAVLRDGQNSGDLSRAEIDHDAMVKLMVGRDVAPPSSERGARGDGELALQVDELVVPAHPRQRTSFTVQSGEIVGIAGLVGAGRTELLRVLFGIDRPLAGAIRVFGAELALTHPSDAIRAGVALVPEDRKLQGLFLEMAVRENLSIAALQRDQRFGFVATGREADLCGDMIERLRIDTPSGEQPVGLLSGGNQQKVVLGRWLSLGPRVLLLDEPTRGIDVGARHEIYRLMHELAARGVAILFASSEMEEILTVPDRVLVMHEGRIAGELAGVDLSEEAVMQLATGATAVQAES